MEGTGGVRKLRWRRGKSGGVRVIDYIHSEAMSLYLQTLCGKHDRTNLSKAERGGAFPLVAIWPR